MRLFRILSLVAVMFSMSKAVALGGMTSSGGDYKAMDWESAWFLGDAPVSYCIEVGPQEKVSIAQVQSDFESVVQTWQKYRADRRRHQTEGQELNFNFQLEPCSASTRLRIYVGASNSETDQGKKLYQNPYAFSYRTTYDPAAGLGRGYIWLAPTGSVLPKAGPKGFPNWSTPYTLHGMLLHEMGHVFGCGHVEGTIMEADMVGDLQMAESNDPKWAAGGKMYMTNIDHHRFLLLNWDAKLEMKGDFSYDITGSESARIFELLVGRKPKGKIRAEVSIQSGKMTLLYQDDIGPWLFQLPLIEASSFDLGGQVFMTVRDNVGGSVGTSGYVFQSSIRSKQGINYSAVVSVNGAGLGRPIDVKILEGGKFTQIFFSDLWLTHGIE